MGRNSGTTDAKRDRQKPNEPVHIAADLPFCKASPRGRYSRNLSPQDRSVRQRDLLIAAGTDVIASKGFAYATVADIVSASGMSRATFYIHFNSKDDLLAAIIHRRVGEILISVKAAARDTPNPLKALTHVIDTYLRLMQNGGAFTRVMLMAAAAGGDQMRKVREQRRQELIEIFRQIENSIPAENQGHFSHSDVTLRALVCGMEEAVYGYLLNGNIGDLSKEMKPGLTRFVKTGLGIMTNNLPSSPMCPENSVRASKGAS